MKYITFIFLCIVSYSNGMEVAKKYPSIPCDNICHLNNMSSSILNCIASFLMETEEEFIARTQATKIIASSYSDFNSLIFGTQSTQYVLCPDAKTSLELIRNVRRGCEEGSYPAFSSRCYEDKIRIVDVLKEKVIHEEEIDGCDRYACLALSRGNSMIAVIYEKDVLDAGKLGIVSDYYIEVWKIGMEKKRNLDLPNIINERIAFNKQGTHLIAHGRCFSNLKAEHKIIPLKIIDSEKEQVIIPTTNRLQEYFRDKFVCNKCIEGINIK